MKIRISEKKTLDIPARTLIHGEPGVGKTTFAAGAPDVVFICTEQGTNNLAVQRARLEDETALNGERDPNTFEETCLVLDALIAGAKQANIKNVAIDTIDSLEKQIHDHLCKMGNKRSIADFTYGKGFDLAVDAVRAVLSRLEKLQSVGVGIILLAHTKTENFNNPEGQDFNYYEVKVNKKIGGLLVEWCDNVLFARRGQYALEENGKVRGVGDGARFLHTQKAPTFVAKNRFDLPEKLPLSWSEYQRAMEQHRPADPVDLRSNAEELLKQLDKETKIAATASLAKISKDDARTLTQFVDFCRSKISLQEVTK